MQRSDSLARCLNSRKNSSHKALACAAAAVLSSVVLPLATQAQNLTFDPDGMLPLAPGFAEWNTTQAKWYDGATFTTYTAGANVTLQGGGVESASSATVVNVGSVTLLGNTTILGPQAGPAAGTFTMSQTTFDTGAFTLNLLGHWDSPLNANTITKTGSGALVVHRRFGTGNAGASNGAGSININQGTIGLANRAADFSDSFSLITVASGAAFNMGYAGGSVDDTLGGFRGAGQIILGTYTDRGVTVGSSLTAGTVTIGTETWSGTMSGGGRYQKVGTGTLIFSGTNTFTGPTSVQTGALVLTNAAALANTSDVFVNNAASSRLVIQSNKTLGSLGGGGATGGVVDIGTNTLNVGGNNNYNGFGGNFIGSGTVVKSGSGLWSIQNATPVSAFTGKYVIESGTLSFRDDARIAAVPGGLVTDAVTLAGGVLANSNGGNVTWNANRGITVTADSGISVLGSTASFLQIDAPFAGAGKVTKTGDGILNLNADSAGFSGDWAVRDGTLSTSKGVGAPFGTGGFDVAGSTVNIAPGAAGISVNHSLASGVGETFRYGPGSVLYLNKNAGNTDLTVTLGGLQRNSRGTLVIGAAQGIASLSTAGNEKLLVTGGAGTINGIVPGVIGTTSAISTPGNFLTYDNTDGFKLATYSSTDLATSSAADVVNQTAGVTLAGPASAYAVRIGDGTNTTAVDLGGSTLTVGSGTDPAMVILNTTSTIANGTLEFGSRQAVIYSQGAAGNVSAVINGSNGLSKVGAGPLNLTTAATYTGATHISQGSVVTSGNDFLPTSTALTIENNGVLNIGTNSQSVSSLDGNRTANILMSGGTLTIGAGNSTYLGRINSGASASGTLIKDGAGTLTLGVSNSQTGNDSESLLYSSLQGKNGAIITMGSTLTLPAASSATITGTGTQSLPTSPVLPASNNVSLDGATLRFTQVNSAAFQNGGASSYTFAASSSTLNTSTNVGTTTYTLRALSIGAGGGTIEVVDPKEIVIMQYENNGSFSVPIVYGSGTVTKTGPGFLRLGTGNDASFTGKWVIKGGNLQFQNGNSLGSAASPTSDFLTLDGGMIQNNGTGVIGANLGFTVAAGGGTLNGSWQFANTWSGSGVLNKVGSGTTARFDASSPSWTSPIIIREGFVDARASDALGTGPITIAAELPTGLFKLGGLGDSTLTNNITLNTGSTIDFRVDSIAGPLWLTGNIGGPAGFIKTGGTGSNGQGTLVLAGNNTFAGDLVIDGGVLIAASNTATGAATGLLTVNPTASLAFSHVTGVNIASGKTTFIAGDGAGLGAIRNIDGNNTYAPAITLTQNAMIDTSTGTLNLSGGIRGKADLTTQGGGSLSTSVIRVNGLTVNGNTAITSGRSTTKTSTVTSLSTGAMLDLGDNDLVVDYTGSAPTLTFGFAGGAWNGTGLVSSLAGASVSPAKTALGWAEATDLGSPATFSGVSIDNTALLVRYTWAGDANLDGKVNTVDFNQLAGSFNAAGDWFNGDFNYDNLVDSVDLGFLLGTYGMAAIPSPSLGGTLGAVVPEPSTLSLLGLGVAGLFGRRRRS